MVGMTTTLSSGAEQRGQATQPGSGRTRGGARRKRITVAQLNEAVLGIKLRGRDERVLIAVRDYTVLAGSEIKELCYDDLSPASAEDLKKERLGHLVEAGFLLRRIEGGKKTYYSLGPLGVRYLEEMGMKAKAASTALFHHDQQTAAVMVEIIKEMRRLGGICEWESEVDSEGRDRKRVAPDATGKVTDQHGRRFVFFLETDMGTETNITFGKKVINYERYYKVGNWQATLERKSFPVVLVVTSSSSRRRDMEKRIKGLMQAVATQRKVDDNQIAWYFTSTERLARYVGVVNGDGRGPLQAPVWSRDGQEALEGIM